MPWPFDKDRLIPAEPGIMRRLRAGDSAGALAIAIARLRSAGIRPPLQTGFTDRTTARLWAAALVFPIDRRTAIRAITILDPSLKGLLDA
jgi:CRISPR-associated protein Csx17